MKQRLGLIAIGALLLADCSPKGHGVRFFNEEDGFPAQLSSWNLFDGKQSYLRPNAGVKPYEVTSPLFSDYATKRRFVFAVSEDLPVGSILVKNFAYNGRLIETRLLAHTRTGWFPLPYVWNAEQTDAHLDMSAAPVPVTFTKPNGAGVSFAYAIPNANQCTKCHGTPVMPIGYPKRNRVVGTTLDERSRAYLEANCLHCHEKNLWQYSPKDMLRTMESTDPAVMMPSLGRRLVHEEGVELIKDWIAKRNL